MNIIRWTATLVQEA